MMKAAVEESLRAGAAGAVGGRTRTQTGTKRSNHRSNHGNHHKTVVSVRRVAAALASFMVCYTLYRGMDVTSSVRSTMHRYSGIDAHAYYPHDRKADAASSVYPRQFRALQHERHESKGSLPVAGEPRERSRIHREFRAHNRKSVYSLFLLPRKDQHNETTDHNDNNNNNDNDNDNENGNDNTDETTTTTTTTFRFQKKSMDTVMQWGNLFSYIFQHAHKRHNQGLYEFHSLWGHGLKESEAIKHRQDPDVLRAAWGNNQYNSNGNGNSNGNTKPKRKHPRTQPRTHPQPQPQPHPQTPRLIHEHDLCRAFHHARNIAGFQTPHVLLTHLNENWGALSTEVANRTHEWGDVVKNWRGHSEPCDPLELKELYLDSPHTLAVFTVQHQALFDHPKVHSIPIGVGNSRDGANALLNSLLRQAKRWQPHGGADAPHRRRGRRLQPNTTESSDPVEGDPRPQLLMINSSPTPTRTPQIEAVIRNFQESGLPEARGLTNTYGEKGVDKHTDARTLYHNEISRSKFILCPSGIGWDTYRIWESIVLGAIPVIEKHRYEYEKIVYPPSANKRPRLLHSQEHWNAQKMRRHLRRFNATLETVGYYDGWRKSMDDLPVLWIDGTFGDELTPELLVEQYDALAGRAAEFRYEKLTSLYWMQFLESFLLNHNANGNGNHDALVWQRAMETLSSTFNDHSTSVKKFMKQAAAKQIDDDLVQVGDDGAGDDAGDDAGVRAGVGDGGDVDDGDGTDGAGVPSYLFGSRQPEILSWVLFAELKLVGIVLVVVAIRRWDADANADAAKSDPDKTNGDVGSKR
mmetsp:Transcript_16172/g.33594  ORF Transcript_16172/g.33594 Transcript_16172/m.33594 type:complete len:805 (-) Transcript_16172:361-2775(-)